MKKLVFKIIITFFTVAFTFSGASAQERYVRKKVPPNFFIPQGELSETKQEKVAIPKYRQGTSTAKHISAEEQREAEMLAAKQRRFKTQDMGKQPYNPQTEEDNISTVAETTPEPETTQISVRKNPATKNAKGDEVPDYQQKYQEYLQDLDAIAATGTVTNNPGVDEDLGAMSSEKRITIDKKFNEKRDVKSEINKLLK